MKQESVAGVCGRLRDSTFTDALLYIRHRLLKAEACARTFSRAPFCVEDLS